MTKFYSVCIVLLSLSLANESLATIRLGIAGSQSKSHLGLQELTSVSGKGSISFDIGSYVRLGYSYAQAFQHQEGYENKADEGEPKELVYREQDIRQISHSINLFIVLYAGEIFTPFIFGGGGIKRYIIDTNEEGADPDHKDVTIPSPSGGAGLSIALSQNFSMKLTHTSSLGMSEDVNGKEASEIDTQFDVGLSYKID